MKKVLSYIVEKNDERMIKMKYYFDWKNNIDQKALQIAINELKTGICVSVMTLKAFQTLFNEGVINEDYFVYFYEV